ncbi:PREDICTED: myelin and lymphocyte protein [Ficedula albicollis]|uniref:myelin and lymphocyte protein n=1 Tax=Ficedula albicollis TaxID=59894 RepID=UPI0003599E31|nr:PREDICTED: myelin and lymphocyte protein [Ficedula albicollis]
MSSSTSTSTLPSGLAVLTTFPDVLFIPEIVFAFAATLVYVIHKVFSLLRWKSS